MKMKHFILGMTVILLACMAANAQSNIHFTKPESHNILTGNYIPPAELPTPLSVLSEIMHEEINTDSLHNYLVALSTFKTRNTGSDTLSETLGIGASQRWCLDRFNQIAESSGTSSIADFLVFDQVICEMNRHKNVVFIHPGTDPEAGVIIIEAHLDSRCEDVCDIDCIAEGMEDNGSGCALVIELARVLSKHRFKRSIVFMLTTAEEQGLWGADAMAIYCQSNNIDVKAVLNNDVVGGILCGETASPPGCPGQGHVDSTQVRIFSFGANGSKYKGLARYAKLQYTEEVLPITDVPMLLSLMSAEDRTGRGGDHIPFRERSMTSIRFTSANENGDAMINAEYHDHQHSTRDILGIDSNGDGALDSFFVDFNYLKRNTIINGITACALGVSPEIPTMELAQKGNDVEVTLSNMEDYTSYRVGLRTDSNDFDSLYTLIDTHQIRIPAGDDNILFFSACVVDENNVESCFSTEDFIFLSAVEDTPENPFGNKIELLQNRPNPFDEVTTITVLMRENIPIEKAEIIVTNAKGSLLASKPMILQLGFNEYEYYHGWGNEGILYYSLYINNQLIETKSMIFAY